MEIYTILLEQQEIYKKWLNESNPVQRELAGYYHDCIESSLVKVIMGPRRCGKSFFSVQSLPHDQTLYINFDDERFFKLQAKELNKIYESALRIMESPKFWVFDEIQNIEGWELFINRLRRNGLNIIVTGSNSKLLSKELATHLTGRTLSLELLPFSFKEYLRFFKIEYKKNILPEDSAKIENHFETYLKYGGFPETFTNKVAYEYLRELFDRIITKDVIQRYQIRDPKVLRFIAHIMINSSSQELSYQKIKNSFSGLSINTLKRYINCLEETYLFFEIETYSRKIKERLTKTRKTYSIDTGIFNSLSDNPKMTLGRQLENLVFLELKRRKKKVCFLKTKKFEMDFLVQDELKAIELIQVCWDFSSEKTKERELKGFAEAEKILGRQKKLLLFCNNSIISQEEKYFREINAHEIVVLPVWKWLLDIETK